MPMVYVSKEADDLLKRIVEYLRMNKDKDMFGRVLKTDVIKMAVEDRARKMGVN